MTEDEIKASAGARDFLKLEDIDRKDIRNKYA